MHELQEAASEQTWEQHQNQYGKTLGQLGSNIATALEHGSFQPQAQNSALFPTTFVRTGFDFEALVNGTQKRSKRRAFLHS